MTTSKLTPDKTLQGATESKEQESYCLRVRQHEMCVCGCVIIL